ncbi:MAG: dihydroorotate dehydrogenase electron transfer subunit [Nitrospiraceae bacterium]|nr:dihydroorotate dehydrogenase electron transfer subunit [Nitrospiraceae bacterium]
MSRSFKAEIRENRPVNSNHNLLTLAPLDIMVEPRPGQFYMLEISRGLDPLLKRAFSLFRRTSDGFQILYRIKGKGTSILRELKEGTLISLLGPLGNGYPLPAENQAALVIAGGIGIASVFSLVEKLEKKAHLFYGARLGDEIFMTDEMSGRYRELIVCTDDGSCGRKGTVVDALNDFLGHASLEVREPVIYACGPQPMLREISRIAVAKGITAYLSLEEHMACGIGACLGCVVKTKDGYRRVCKEGPVFEAGEIVW